MKLGTATKYDKRNTKKSKRIDKDIMSAYYEPSGSQIHDARSVVFTFSLIITFYLTKTESRTKTPLTQ